MESVLEKLPLSVVVIWSLYALSISAIVAAVKKYLKKTTWGHNLMPIIPLIVGGATGLIAWPYLVSLLVEESATPLHVSFLLGVGTGSIAGSVYAAVKRSISGQQNQ